VFFCNRTTDTAQQSSRPNESVRPRHRCGVRTSIYDSLMGAEINPQKEITGSLPRARLTCKSALFPVAPRVSHATPATRLRVASVPVPPGRFDLPRPRTRPAQNRSPRLPPAFLKTEVGPPLPRWRLLPGIAPTAAEALGAAINVALLPVGGGGGSGTTLVSDEANPLPGKDFDRL